LTLNLLPHQFSLLKDDTTKILGLVSGFGAGKTWIVARKAVDLIIKNPGCDGIVTEPNFPLLNQILIPELKKALHEFGIPYEYKSGDSIFECQVQDNIKGSLTFGKVVKTRIIAKSMESYDRLIGINAAWVIMDEFDTAKSELAYNAYIKLLGRIRVGNKRQMVIVSTPEGFKAFHRIFVEEKDENKRLIKAKTTDNHHLPVDYIKTMRSQYPKELIDAYLNGEFVNLTQGSVYSKYDRSRNDTFVVDDGQSELHVGIDFNVEHMSAVVCLFKDQKLYVVDEFKDYFDTPDLIEAILQRYDDRVIYAYPDASGKNRSSNDASVTNHKLLRQANFKVRVNSRNPNVQDRINTVNARLRSADDDTHLFINSLKCPELVKGLEQQVYDNGKPDKSQGIDHQLDALGYVVSFLLPLTFSRKVRKTTSYVPHVNK